MKQCPVVQDLLPLYVDDALSPASRAMVDTHLPDCPDCRRSLAALQVGAASLPQDSAAPSDDTRFLTRLKRQVGAAAGVALVLLVVTGFGATQYGEWRADRERGKQMQAQIQGEKAALAAMREASPDPLARLRHSGVSLSYSASRNGGTVRVNYVLTAAAPADVAHTFLGGYAPSPRLVDPATGKEVGRFSQGGGQGYAPGQRVSQWEAIFEGVTAVPAGAQVQFPTVLVYVKPEQQLRWEIQRPFEEGDVAIGQRFTVSGVEFEVERIRFTKDAAQIDYRQLTPPAQVGLHLLSFRLSDRMGGTWSDTHLPERLPDPLRPSQHFEFVASLSKNWLIQVQHAVLALPGPTLPLEVN